MLSFSHTWCRSVTHTWPAFGMKFTLGCLLGLWNGPTPDNLIKCHMIFDVKIGENFHRKARLVAGGHTTDAPATLTYLSVVSRDSVRIALTIAVLNRLEVMACNIQNAYLTAD